MSNQIQRPADLPIFLGLCNSAARHGMGIDLLGITFTIVFPFFPQSMNGLVCLLGMKFRDLSQYSGFSFRIIFTIDDDAENYATANIEFSSTPLPVNNVADMFPNAPVLNNPYYAFFQSFDSEASNNEISDFASYQMLFVPSPPLNVVGPAKVNVDIEWKGALYRLGSFFCAFSSPPPLSQAERRAIASRLTAPKGIGLEIKCKQCGNNAFMYELLNSEDTIPSEWIEKGAIHLQDAPDYWVCNRCANPKPTNLVYLKHGVHDLFRRTAFEPSNGEIASFRPYYEQGRLSNIHHSFQLLIEAQPSEEEVQKFIEKYPVIWAFLSPVKILHKPPLLVKHKADFGIITSQRILYLIEIEKPQTRLFAKSGALSHEIEKGFKQIRDWIDIVDDHRHTLIDQLQLRPEEVHDIRYMLIAGLTHACTGEELRKLRRDPRTDSIQFYCFDELSAFLHILQGRLGEL